MELTQYNPVRAEIEAIKAKSGDLVFDYFKPAGNKLARSYIFELRKKRADVERVRKATKEDAIEFGRKVDAVAKELTGELDQMIAVHQKPLDEIEAKYAAEKAAADAKLLAEKMEAERIEREKQQAILDAERAEAARVKAELEAMRLKAREDQIRHEAAEKARVESEQKRYRESQASLARERAAEQAAIDAKQAKIDAERREIEAKKAAIEAAEQAKREQLAAAKKAEQDKIDAAARAKANQEAAVAKAIADQERKQREDAERSRRLQREAEEQRLEAESIRRRDAKVRAEILRDITDSILSLATLDRAEAWKIATAILDGKISRVTASTAKFKELVVK